MKGVSINILSAATSTESIFTIHITAYIITDNALTIFMYVYIPGGGIEL